MKKNKILTVKEIDGLKIRGTYFSHHRQSLNEGAKVQVETSSTRLNRETSQSSRTTQLDKDGFGHLQNKEKKQ